MRHTQPSFSIIIPTHNRPQQLRQCLEAVVRLDYPKERFEVIVVDDGSELAPAGVIKSFTDSLQIALLIQPNAGPASARNYGAQEASGDFLAFTDDDCQPEPNWLRAFAEVLSREPGCLAGGRTINELSNNPFSEASQIIVDIVYRHYNQQPQAATFFASNNMAIARDGFYKLNGFDNAFRTSEDRDFCARWLQIGGRMVYVADALIGHAHHLSFSTYCQQHFNYGRGAYRFQTKCREANQARLTSDFKFHLNLQNWLIYPFTRVRKKRASLLAGLLIVWQVANLAGFLFEAIRGSKNAEKKPKHSSIEAQVPISRISES